MAKEVKKHGTGITAYELLHYSDEDVTEGLKDGFRSMSEGIKENGGLFGWRTSSMVGVAEEILSVAGDGPYEDQTAEDYAHKIHSFWRLAKKAIAKGNADEAARWAYELGSLGAEAAMKFEWEPFVLEKQKHVERRREVGQLGAEAVKRRAAERHKLLRLKASEILSRNASLSAADVGREVLKWLKKNIEQDEVVRCYESSDDLPKARSIANVIIDLTKLS